MTSLWDVLSLSFLSSSTANYLRENLKGKEYKRFILFLQLDADRDEEEVFCDISMTLDNKLFPSKEPAAGEINTYLFHINIL